jgi:hypothetical protein
MRLRFLALLLLASCDASDDLLANVPRLRLTPVAAPFQLDPATGTATVQLRLTNEHPNTVYVAGCDNKPLVALERRNGSAWENAAAAVCPASLSAAPVAVGALSGINFTVAAGTTGSFRAVASTSFVIAGSYQPLSSNEFSVR